MWADSECRTSTHQQIRFNPRATHLPSSLLGDVMSSAALPSRQKQKLPTRSRFRPTSSCRDCSVHSSSCRDCSVQSWTCQDRRPCRAPPRAAAARERHAPLLSQFHAGIAPSRAPPLALGMGMDGAVADAACANSCSGHGQCGAAKCVSCCSLCHLSCIPLLRSLVVVNALSRAFRAASARVTRTGASPQTARCASVRRGQRGRTKLRHRMLRTQALSARTADFVTTARYSLSLTLLLARAIAVACCCSLRYPLADVPARLKCPGDCLGHGLCHSLATLGLLYGPDTASGVGGDGLGPQYTNWERDNIQACLCDTGYTGPDCSMSACEMCPKNDDPLTTGQGYRTIKIRIGGTASLLVGTVGVAFNGEVATIDASAAGNTASTCASAFMQLRSVARATCTITVLDNTVKSAEYVVEFTEWAHIDAENNLLFHNGNPPLSAFTCDISKVTSANTPTCAITDIVASNVIEHVYCSNRGVCDFATGACTCYADFKAVDCNQPSNVPDSIEDNDGFLVYPQGTDYRGNVLHLKTVKSSAPDFNFMLVESASYPVFTMDGLGHAKLLKGNMEISTGNLKVQAGATIVTGGLNVQAGGSTITSSDAADTTTELVSTSSIFTGTALKVRTSRASHSAFKLMEFMTGTSTVVVTIRGDGLTTIQTGGLSVVTGGATISDNQLNAPIVKVISDNTGFTGSVLKIDTTRSTQYPSPDYLLIEANANGAQAFSVQASGKTTIYNGGLLVQSADTVSGTLVVKPTLSTFGSDAVSIQTTSSSAHVLLKASVSNVLLFKIENTGLTTIDKGGLYVTTGGATIQAGGLHVYGAGETIHAGGLRITNGGQTINLDGLNVIDGGSAISSTSTTAPVLAVTSKTATSPYSGPLLQLDTQYATQYPNVDYLLIEANANGAQAFSVQASGKTTIYNGGLLVQSADTASGTLLVKPTSPTFGSDAVSIQTSSSSAHVLLKASSSSGLLFKIENTGLTTIAKGGLSVADGASVTVATDTDSAMKLSATHT
ncbi:hypothetical protein PybrP1_002508, partial [[Pythium] brassicae (nom. inval.)]